MTMKSASEATTAADRNDKLNPQPGAAVQPSAAPAADTADPTLGPRLRARTGKIARLPEAIRTALNERLADGHESTVILDWLNRQPETKAVLKAQFGGNPVSKQNLSVWRQGGFQEWIRVEESLDLFERLYADEGRTKPADKATALADLLNNRLLLDFGIGYDRRLRAAASDDDYFTTVATAIRSFATLRRTEFAAVGAQIEASKEMRDRESHEMDKVSRGQSAAVDAVEARWRAAERERKETFAREREAIQLQQGAAKVGLARSQAAMVDARRNLADVQAEAALWRMELSKPIKPGQTYEEFSAELDSRLPPQPQNPVAATAPISVGRRSAEPSLYQTSPPPTPSRTPPEPAAALDGKSNPVQPSPTSAPTAGAGETTSTPSQPANPEAGLPRQSLHQETKAGAPISVGPRSAEPSPRQTAPTPTQFATAPVPAAAPTGESSQVQPSPTFAPQSGQPSPDPSTPDQPTAPKPPPALAWQHVSSFLNKSEYQRKHPTALDKAVLAEFDRVSAACVPCLPPGETRHDRLEGQNLNDLRSAEGPGAPVDLRALTMIVTPPSIGTPPAPEGRFLHERGGSFQ
jgi:hypothetical protein